MTGFFNMWELQQIWENSEETRWKFVSFKRFVAALEAELEKAPENETDIVGRLRRVMRP